MSIKNKLVSDEDERAVSPVIGVILMVAITVILAAVIAAFVLDLGQTSANPQAGYSITDDSGSATVQMTSIERLDEIRFDGSGCTSGDSDLDDAPGSGSYVYDDTPSVGTTYETNCDIDDITIIGVYEGSEVVLN